MSTPAKTDYHIEAATMERLETCISLMQNALLLLGSAVSQLRLELYALKEPKERSE